MNTPLISIVVPVYNVAEYLPSCIDSITNQSYAHFELLLVNDGSSDRSGDICDEYARRDPRIRVFHKSNGGVSSARNLALAEAKGEWFLFVDGDDLLPPGILQTYIAAALEQQVRLVISRMRFNLDEGGTRFVIPEKRYGVMRGENPKRYLMTALRNFEMSFCGKLYHRELLEAVRFPAGIPYYEDYMCLWQVARKRPDYAIINEVGYIVRWRQGSASRRSVDIQVYKRRFDSLIYACRQMAALFGDAPDVVGYLSVFVVSESFFSRNLYMHLKDPEDSEVVNRLAGLLWTELRASGRLSWPMRWVLRIRMYSLKRNVSGFPVWQYRLGRLVVRLDRYLAV